MSVFEFPSLKFLDLGYCKFDLIPPVTVMFLNQKLKNLNCIQNDGCYRPETRYMS